jgi:hypothetical protein
MKQKKQTLVWVHAECGSAKVEAQAWVDANTGEVIDEQENADFWCEFCGNHTKRLCQVDARTRHCVDCDTIHTRPEGSTTDTEGVKS